MTHPEDSTGVIDLGDEADTPHDISQLKSPIYLPQRILQAIGAAMLVFLAIFITIAVLLRYTGNGIIGAVEIAAMLMVVTTVLVIPAATAADENFRVEVADFFLKEKGLRILDILSLVVQLLVALFLAAAAIDLLLHDIATRTTMGGELEWPRWLLSLPVAAGFLGIVYSTLIVIFKFRSNRVERHIYPEA
ncbi:Tripartite ATP-independent periplasmic transporter, DctQ component [Corynebacterium occultum]|uniref:Tripartite ATP-independent periplasmic transporter, DctQ component n=1 Tax=Corynebacterium occultum TaxID=2675219 RepID=A0A6B8VPB8_9CORY|nr:TRAP transporter small permease subunit [Corynebacterium occultum]QGU07422.1 Tripartite ATP-independent periplasmic transporter, DctQ component [Corynebacterium occultum]